MSHNCQTDKLSDYQTVRLSDCQTVRLSDCQTVRLSDCQTVRLSDCRIVRLSDCQTVRLSDLLNFAISTVISTDMEGLEVGLRVGVVALDLEEMSAEMDRTGGYSSFCRTFNEHTRNIY